MPKMEKRDMIIHQCVCVIIYQCVMCVIIGEQSEPSLSKVDGKHHIAMHARM